MLGWLEAMRSRDIVMTMEDLANIALVLFNLLAIFFLYSCRMNARLEAPEPAPNKLLQLACALSEQAKKPKQPNVFVFLLVKMERQVIWLLRKTDWLLRGKLKLLPDVRAGRRINCFLLLYTACLVPCGSKIMVNDDPSEAIRRLLSGCDRAQLYSLSIIAVVVAFAIECLPLVLLPRKNREFYLDVACLFGSLYFALSKILICWPNGCCYGIAYPWGIYNAELGTTVFPVQLFEAACAFLAFLLCLLYMLYAKSYRPGYGCSACILGSAVPKFYWEFYRGGTQSKELFGLNTAQAVCVAACILAIAWWIWLLPLEKKLMDRFWLFARRRRKHP